MPVCLGKKLGPAGEGYRGALLPFMVGESIFLHFLTAPWEICSTFYLGGGKMP